ncbi:site-specific DNA-methyltransferase [Shewanella algae]|uniref:DNA-methyltransferase n=1 Tax=Shewanella algae TaxID=38313 RepID=UPI00313E8A00
MTKPRQMNYLLPGGISAELFLGCCLEVMPKIQEHSVDLILADVPYGTTRCKWDEIIPVPQMWNQIKRVLKPGGVVLLHAAQPFTAVLTCSNLDWFKYEIVWEKGNATGFYNAKLQPLRAHEHVLVFCSSVGTYNPQMTHGHQRKTSVRKKTGSECYGEGNKGTVYDSTCRYPRSVQFFSSDKQRRKLHPTQKPLALAEWLIKTYSNPGETVLDFCFGSLTTGIASLNTGRNFIGIEEKLKYFEIGVNQLSMLMEDVA